MNHPKTSRLATLLGTASLLTLAQAERGYAAEMVAQAEDIPETVLITGSLIPSTPTCSNAFWTERRLPAP